MTTSFETDTTHLSPGSYLAFDRFTPAYDLQQTSYPEDRDKYYRTLDQISALHAKTLAALAHGDYTQYMTGETKRAERTYDLTIKTEQRRRVTPDDVTPWVVPYDDYVREKLAYVEAAGPHTVKFNADTRKETQQPLKFSDLARFQNGHEHPFFTPLADEPTRHPVRQTLPEVQHKPVSVASAWLGAGWLAVSWLFRGRQKTHEPTPPRLRPRIGAAALTE